MIAIYEIENHLMLLFNMIIQLNLLRLRFSFPLEGRLETESYVFLYFPMTQSFPQNNQLAILWTFFFSRQNTFIDLIQMESVITLTMRAKLAGEKSVHL